MKTLHAIAALLVMTPAAAQDAPFAAHQEWLLAEDGPACLGALADPAAPRYGAFAVPGRPHTHAMTADDWAAFSGRIVEALATPHEGLQAAALRMIIRHGAHLRVGAARVDVMRLARQHEHEAVRMLAVQALAHIPAPGRLAYLRQAAAHERSGRVHAVIAAALRDAEGQ